MISQERIQSFWERCGFVLRKQGNENDPMYVLNKPDGEQYNIWYRGRLGTNKLPVKGLYPPIDFNSIFKYAVPKLEQVDNELRKISFTYNYSQTITCEITRENDFIYEIDKDPATALFLAIEKVI